MAIVITKNPSIKKLQKILSDANIILEDQSVWLEACSSFSDDQCAVIFELLQNVSHVSFLTDVLKKKSQLLEKSDQGLIDEILQEQEAYLNSQPQES